MSYELRCEKEALYRMLTPLFRGYKPSELRRVTLTSDDGHLTVDGGSVAFRVEATGEWDGPVVVSYAGHFLRAARALRDFPLPVVRISVDGTRMRLGAKELRCKCL